MAEPIGLFRASTAVGGIVKVLDEAIEIDGGIGLPETLELWRRLIVAVETHQRDDAAQAIVLRWWVDQRVGDRSTVAIAQFRITHEHPRNPHPSSREVGGRGEAETAGAPVTAATLLWKFCMAIPFVTCLRMKMKLPLLQMMGE